MTIVATDSKLKKKNNGYIFSKDSQSSFIIKSVLIY